MILGQMIHITDGQAHGLCFSVKPDVEVPPSLVNIYQELHDDLGCKIPNNGYLVKWAKQGVLMLNTVLTVRAHQANSHRGIGWEQFTGCRHPCSQCTGPSNRIFTLGASGADEKKHAE